MSSGMTSPPAMSLPSSNMFFLTLLVTSAHCSCMNLLSVSLSHGFAHTVFSAWNYFCSIPTRFLLSFPYGLWPSFPHQWYHLRSPSWKHFIHYTLSSADCVFLHCLCYHMARVISSLLISNKRASSRTWLILFTAKNSACNREPSIE